MYLLAAPPLLVVHWTRIAPWGAPAALGNLLTNVFSLSMIERLSDGANRILRETQGFRDLASLASGLGGPVYAERYQDVAMLRFYRPGISSGQWPGLGRPSEYMRGPPGSILVPSTGPSGFWPTGASPRISRVFA